jgi:hypothetical protein
MTGSAMLREGPLPASNTRRWGPPHCWLGARLLRSALGRRSPGPRLGVPRCAGRQAGFRPDERPVVNLRFLLRPTLASATDVIAERSVATGAGLRTRLQLSKLPHLFSRRLVPWGSLATLAECHRSCGFECGSIQNLIRRSAHCFMLLHSLSVGSIPGPTPSMTSQSGLPFASLPGA